MRLRNSRGHGRFSLLLLRRAVAILCWVCVLNLLGVAGAPVRNKAEPAFETPQDLEMKFDGFVGSRLRANLEEWELRAPDSNPALVEVFFDRDRTPARDLLPWHGEFVGKYLCSSILSHRILRDPRQKTLIDRTVRRFQESQGPDGYLGPFNKENRLTGTHRWLHGTHNWDVWGHYWAMRALMLYSEEFSDASALATARRAADLLVATYLNKGLAMTNDGSHGQMNYAVIHAFGPLYRLTGKPEYLEMAKWIVSQWDKPGGPLYMSMVLAGREMYELPGNRWESLHDFLGLYELYLLTGDSKYREVFTRLWYSILKGDRHNTGGFTSGERTTGNPYDLSPIETCCTVAWIDMSIAMLKLSGNSLVADEIELSTLNGNLGGQSPSGSWWTYNTPMDGVKEASAHTINFQCRPGSPELNCCSVNGPRGLSLLAEWAVLSSPSGPVVNYYGPSSFRTSTPESQILTILEDTNYPVSGAVRISLQLPRPETFELKLRIPSWSARTEVTINDQETASEVRPGSYLSLVRPWRNGDTISLSLDMSFHYWAGERELLGKASIYRGPILLAFDPAYNQIDRADLPQLEAESLVFDFETTPRSIKPWILLKVNASDGSQIRLCDFATAGAYGNFYRTWLPIKSVAPVDFAPEAPVWSQRPR
ncbi:MAG: beta-L-arabinofuranosidase domain-containing protein [Acidobacteriota bacterium]